MTRRGWFWLFGLLVGLAPLAGCAHLRGNNAAKTSDARQTEGDQQAFNTAAAPTEPELPREPKIETPQDADRVRSIAQKVLNDQPPLPPSPTTSDSVGTVLPVGVAKEPMGPQLPLPTANWPPVSPTNASPPPVSPTNAKPPTFLPAVKSPAELKLDSEPLTSVAKQPATLPKREPLVDAVECYVNGQFSEAVAYLAKYDAPTQEVFLRVLPILGRMTQKSIDQFSSAEVAVFYDQLQGLLVSMRPNSKLDIDKACFCKWVKSYGIYQPLPEGHAFLGSAPNRPGELVQLYVELRNFASELQSGAFATRLSSAVEILDQKKERVWYYRFDDGKQPIRSRTQLHDYFNNYSFYVPNSLPAGTYTLKIHVTDETRRDQPRTTTRSLEFRVTQVAARVP